MKKPTLLVALVLTPASLLASEHFWIIGGGPTPDGSQAQIEFNVAWIIESLRALVPQAEINVFFANGAGPEPATVEYVAELDSLGTVFEPLARVFGQPEAGNLRFRPHAIEGVDGSTRADLLVPELGRQLAELRPGEAGMIVYNGHGSWAPDRAQNGLRLWGETRLDVRDFESLLSRVDTAVPIRFVLTQCFSGAFERAVHPDAADVLELAPGRRCGFFAESDSRESEGCSASIDIGDYRDYTTYFFAALTGRTRLGEPVAERVLDWDGDGLITPYDAHLFALAEGHNADLPRSTSEVYLERWQPWYSRWVGTGTTPDNLYGRLAERLAERNGLPAGGVGLSEALDARFRELVDRIERLSEEERRVTVDANRIQESLRSLVTQKWPALSYPYTPAYGDALEESLEPIVSSITAAVEYPELVRLQERSEQLEIELMNLDRDLSQLEKIRRARVLARSLDQLERHGSRTDLESYERLRSCEALPLGTVDGGE